MKVKKWMRLVLVGSLSLGLFGCGALQSTPGKTAAVQLKKSSSEEEKMYVTGCKKKLKVYEKADKDSEVVGKLALKDKVIVIDDDDDDYYEIEAVDQDIKGYVDAHYLTDSKKAVTKPGIRYISKDKVDMLDDSEEDSDLVATLNKGTAVTIIAKPAGDYYYVYSKDADEYGYVEVEVLSKEKPVEEKKEEKKEEVPKQQAQPSKIFGAGTPPTNYYGPYYVYVDSGYLALRNAMAFDASNELGAMYNNEQVYVLETGGQYWYVYSPTLGMYGYTNANYLYTAPQKKQTSNPTYYASVKTGYLALRNAMAYDTSNEIAQLANGTAVELVDKDTGTEYWYVYVPSLDMYGYVNGNYLTK